MERATLTISLPLTMNDFIGKKLREGHFRTPTEYFRSLVHDNLALNTRGKLVAIVRLRDDRAPFGRNTAMTGTGPSTNGTLSRPNRQRISAGWAT